jgi:WD40 repeat protein
MDLAVVDLVWTLCRFSFCSFDFSPGYKFIASCGMDRHIMLWNPFSAKSIGSLSGHSASIKEVLMVEQEHQLVSVGVDKVIKASAPTSNSSPN